MSSSWARAARRQSAASASVSDCVQRTLAWARALEGKRAAAVVAVPRRRAARAARREEEEEEEEGVVGVALASAATARQAMRRCGAAGLCLFLLAQFEGGRRV